VRISASRVEPADGERSVEMESRWHSAESVYVDLPWSHYAQCRVLFTIALNVIMLSVIAECHYAECRSAPQFYSSRRHLGY